MTGLTAQGFLAETFQSLRTLIFSRLRIAFGNGLPLDDSTIEGQSWAILIEALTKLWELGELLYASQDPDKATGAALDALCVLTGTFREPPSFGIGKLVLCGDNATTVPGGSDVGIGAAGARATTIADAALATAPSRAALTPYALGALVKNNGQIYYALAAGTSGNNTSPSLDFEPRHTSRPVSMIAPLLTADGFVAPDGSIVWIWVGEGAAAVGDVRAVALEAGPVNFPSFAIDSVINPTAGWNGVANPLDFTLGRSLQTDEDLRVSREENLSAPGTGTIDAIAAAIAASDTDVVSVTVFVNNTDVVDADGMPPHSIEALVRGGADQTIRDTLLANVAAGIATFGNTSGTAIDSQGTAHLIRFSRPTEIPIYVAITLTKDAKLYPPDGNGQVVAAVVSFGDAQKTGKDAVAQSIGAQSNKVDGVVEVTDVKIGTAPGPTLSTTIAISLRQLAVFDTSRVSVSSSDVTP